MIIIWKLKRLKALGTHEIYFIEKFVELEWLYSIVDEINNFVL